MWSLFFFLVVVVLVLSLLPFALILATLVPLPAILARHPGGVLLLLLLVLLLLLLLSLVLLLLLLLKLFPECLYALSERASVVPNEQKAYYALIGKCTRVFISAFLCVCTWSPGEKFMSLLPFLAPISAQKEQHLLLPSFFCFTLNVSQRCLALSFFMMRLNS